MNQTAELEGIVIRKKLFLNGLGIVLHAFLYFLLERWEFFELYFLIRMIKREYFLNSYFEKSD